MRILAVSLNPSVDHTLFVEGLVLGAIHRTDRALTSAGGKGVNAARAAADLGAEVVVVGPVGGPSGTHLARLADGEAFGCRWVEVAGSTRICTLIADPASGVETVVNEVGPSLVADEWDRLLAAILAEIDGVDAAVLSGSLPPGAPVDAYRRLIEALRPVPVVLDARGGELRAALETGPPWVHLTVGELEETVGHALPDPDARWAALDRLRDEGARSIVLTDGPGPVLVADAAGGWRLDPPAVPVQTTIGCGDALAGALAVGLALDVGPAERAARAVAAASAAAMTDVPGRLDRAQAAALSVPIAAR